MNAHQRRKALRANGTKLRRKYPIGMEVIACDGYMGEWNRGHVESHSRHGVRVTFGTFPHPVFVNNPNRIYLA